MPSPARRCRVGPLAWSEHSAHTLRQCFILRHPQTWALPPELHSQAIQWLTHHRFWPLSCTLNCALTCARVGSDPFAINKISIWLHLAHWNLRHFGRSGAVFIRCIRRWLVSSYSTHRLAATSIRNWERRRRNVSKPQTLGFRRWTTASRSITCGNTDRLLRR